MKTLTEVISDQTIRIRELEVLLETISSQLKDSGKHEIITTIIDNTLKKDKKVCL